MYIMTVSDLCLSYGTDTILNRISFALEENARCGLIGVNGCGKTTLLKLLSGELEPTSGSLMIPKGKTVGIVHQDSAFLKEDSATTVTERMWRAFPRHLEAENRLSELQGMLDTGDEAVIREYSALHEWYVENGGLTFRSRCLSILSKLGFDDTAQKQVVSSLSGGQRTRLALALQLSAEPDILLLDEPTNHLDIETLEWLESFLISYPKCFIVVSHDRYFLDRVTNQTLSMEYGKAKLYAGGYSKSMEQRRRDREIAEHHWRTQQKEIARQEAYIAQQRAWNRERNIIAAESRQKLLDKMERVERPADDPKAIKIRFGEALSSGNDVLSVRNLSFSYGTKPLLRDLSFEVKRGERVLVIGPNGCGKSTLMKLILSKLTPNHGVIEPGYHVEIGYYDQENQNLDPNQTVLDELWNRYPTKTETEIRSILGLFQFRGDTVFRTVSVLSGGERARLTLAKLMLSKMNFLLLDEPTNHLDMDSREALESALLAFDGTILMVSHDRYLIEKTATRILRLNPPAPFEGPVLNYPVTEPGHGYTELQQWIAARSENGNSEENSQHVSQKTDFAIKKQPPTLSDVPMPPTSAKEQYLQSKKNASQERKKRARTERLKQECARLEAELVSVESLLYGEAANDYVRAAELDTKRTELESRLMELYEQLEN